MIEHGRIYPLSIEPSYEQSTANRSEVDKLINGESDKTAKGKSKHAKARRQRFLSRKKKKRKK